MKAKNILLILASASLTGCTSASLKNGATANIAPDAGYFSPEEFAQLDKIRLSVEAGLAHANKFHSHEPVRFVFDGSPKQQQLPQTISPSDYGRRDMSLIDAAHLPPVDIDSPDRR